MPILLPAGLTMPADHASLRGRIVKPTSRPTPSDTSRRQRTGRTVPCNGKAAIPVVSLFCGAGGLDMGFREAGFEPVLAIDSDKTAVETYNLNLDRSHAVNGNLSSLGGDGVVALVEKHSPGRPPRGVLGGPPCQGFSQGNVHANPRDPRNTLPFRYAAILDGLNRAHGVDFFVFENVPGLKRAKHLARFKRIKARFREAGFTVFEGELNAMDFGVPQSRRRLFLVGVNSERFPGLSFGFPSACGSRATVRDAIGGLPRPVFWKRSLREKGIPFHPNHWTMNPKSPRFASKDFGTSRSFHRLAWDTQCRTVAYGNREIDVHPEGDRRLSILEAMLLQGFPQSFVIEGNLCEQLSQVCNAVPPPVARAVARSVRECLYGRRPLAGRSASPAVSSA